MNRKAIYLDNAATSGIRPEAVYAAMDRQMRAVGGAAHRGQHQATASANAILNRCRQAIARLINAPDSRAIALTNGCTHSLNLAIHGLVSPGMHVVTTAAEHNSVLRPLEVLRRRDGVRVTIVPVNRDGGVDVEALLSAVTPETAFVIVTLASNVSGAITDIDPIGKALATTPTRLICDAAQLIGYRPIDVQRSKIDILAMPGHKGLLGPLGTGALYVAAELQARINPAMQGGTGTSSDSLEMPGEFPQKLEVGNLNVPGFAGLAEGVKFLLEQGLGDTERSRLTDRLLTKLVALPNLRIHGALGTDQRLGVVSFTISGWSPADVAATLDSAFGIEVRAGLHCAPLIHRSLGSHPAGTVRISLGHFSTMEEVDAVVAALEAMVS